MKIAALILYLSIGFSLQTFAQNQKKANKVYWALPGQDNGRDLLTKDLVIDLSQIEDLKTLWTTEIKKRYPGLDANIVLMVTFKPNVKLLKLKEFYKLHNINEETQKISVKCGSA